MSGKDSSHWPLTRGVLGATAVSSSDLRRVLAAAGARRKHPNRVARWALRWLLKLSVWRTRLDGWGRTREGPRPAATPAEADCRNPIAGAQAPHGPTVGDGRGGGGNLTS